MFTSIPFALALSKFHSTRRVQLEDGRKGLIVASYPEIMLALVVTDEQAGNANLTQGQAVAMFNPASNVVAVLEPVPVHFREIGKIKQIEHGWVTVEGEKVTAE
jgi:hypothetical protein